MSPLLVLIVAVLATTYAGPLVRFAAAPALAIAFWRLALVLPLGRYRSPLPAPVNDVVRPSPRPPLLVLDCLAPLHHRRQLSGPRLAEAWLRVGPRSRVAARVSDSRGGLGDRARGDRRERHRSGRRAAVARRPGW